MAAAVNGPNANVRKPNTFWKVVGQGVGWVFKILLLLVVIVILTPAIYFAWRAGQPMEQPAFGGKTLYQVFEDRWQAYDTLEARYRQAHPQEKIVHEMCYWTDVAMNIPAAMIVGFETLRAYFEPNMNLGGVVPRRIQDILPASWSNYEKLLLSLYQYVPQGP